MVKVHFDIEGSVEECQAILAQLGFPISSSMTEAEQDAVAAQELAKAERLKATRVALEGLDGTK